MPHAIAAAAMPVLRSNTAPARLLSSSVARLRIVHVNDVYELDELPRLASLIAHVKAEAKLSGATVIATLGGDFLAPSVLSGLDNGFGMVDCMNRVPFDYVCFGNHEGGFLSVSITANRRRVYIIKGTPRIYQNIQSPRSPPRPPSPVSVSVPNV